jgi:dihydropteroate synthase
MIDDLGKEFCAGEYRLPLGVKTYVMGIVNVTPDSFSDGGQYLSARDAEAHAYGLADARADILDIGGESTRPGHSPVDFQEEIDRVIPVIRRIAPKFDIPVSVDTSKARVAQEAIEAGASIINDVWGLKRDPDIARVAYESRSGLVLMFNATDPSLTEHSGDIVTDAIAYLSGSVDIALRAGVREDQIILDPGIGFGMDHRESFELIKGIGRLKELGFPVLIGPSRKRFIGAALGDLPVDKRDTGTAAASCIAAFIGADMVRVHDVKSVVQAVIISDILSDKRKYEEV